MQFFVFTSDANGNASWQATKGKTNNVNIDDYHVIKELLLQIDNLNNELKDLKARVEEIENTKDQ